MMPSLKRLNCGTAANLRGETVVEIVLKDGQSGYDVVEKYIRSYWRHIGSSDTVICSIETSYDGKSYDLSNEVATLFSGNGDEVEFLYDWWEGQKYLRLWGIRSVGEFAIIGGLYTEDGNEI